MSRELQILKITKHQETNQDPLIREVLNHQEANLETPVREVTSHHVPLLLQEDLVEAAVLQVEVVAVEDNNSLLIANQNTNHEKIHFNTYSCRWI